MKKYLLFLFCILLFTSLFPEESTSGMIQNIMEQIAENKEEEEIDFSLLQDNLQLFAENPIDLNHTTREELERLYFLSGIQIENLLYYLYRFAPMYSIYELQLIEGFDKETIQNMLPFVSVYSQKSNNKFNLPHLLKYGKQSVFMQSRYTIEQKAGYKEVENPDKEYAGSPFYAMLKYKFQSKNRLIFGFTAEKDEGEPFWTQRRKGFDFYSAHLQVNDLGIFKRIIIGDYKAGFGYGLVINNNFSMGKSSYVLNVLPAGGGISSTSSANEVNFFRGTAVCIRIKKFQFSGFYSNQKIDASLAVGQVFTSLKTDGLHRTGSDWEKRKTVTRQVFGGNTTFASQRFKCGITFAGTVFNREWQPKAAPYNLYYFRGKKQYSVGIDYQYSWRRIRIFGETASGFNKSVATLNGFSVNPNSRIAFLMLQRYYSKAYQAVFANSFSENSQINNEQGVYVGLEVSPFKYWKLSAYTDSFRFPWLKHGVDRPSGGYDAFLQAGYTPGRYVSMSFRYKYKQKEKNISIPENITSLVEEYDKSTFKYLLHSFAGKNVQLKSTVETNRAKTHAQKATSGFMIGQEVSYSLQKIPLKIDFCYAFFDAEDYDNRFYSYEKDILYAFSIPMYYGKGSRMYMNVNYTVNKYLSCWFKIAYTQYVDKESIGSDTEMIDGNHKTDMKLMVRCKL